MSIFGNIMPGIFGHGSAKVQPTSTGSVAPSPTSASSSTAAATSAAAPPSQVDVEAVLSKLASQISGHLFDPTIRLGVTGPNDFVIEWLRTSILPEIQKFLNRFGFKAV
jgi:hypothetical protein